MLGATEHSDKSLADIEPWTESDGDDLVKQVFSMIVESQNRRVLSKVAGGLGDEEGTTGGTMGDPRTP